MLTFVSGLPGSGKTLFTIQHVEGERAAELKKRIKETGNENEELRPVYYFGIPELTLDWIKIDNVEDWWKCPPNCYIVIDEAQQIFEKMATSAKRPEHFKKFDVHRHQGHDPFLITQNPVNVDERVKSMCGKHIHLVRPLGLSHAMAHMWPAIMKTDHASVTRDKTANTTRFDYPKEFFKVYKSAEAHTHKREIPYKKIFMLVGMLVLIFAAFYLVFNKVKTGSAMPQTDSTFDESTFSGAVGGQAQTRPDIFSDLEAWRPRVDNVPYSAPVYSNSLQIRDAPRVDGCSVLVFSSGRIECSCNDQRGNTLDIGISACRHYVDNGVFDPTVTESNSRIVRR